MTSARQIKVTMFFPILDNDGHPFQEVTWNWWRDALQRVLQGSYNEPGTTLGHWEGYTDLCRWIVSVIERGRLDEIRSFLAEALSRFRQESMYLDYHAVTIEMIAR